MDLAKEQSVRKNVDIVVSNTYLSAFYDIIDCIKKRTEENKFENIIFKLASVTQQARHRWVHMPAA